MVFSSTEGRRAEVINMLFFRIHNSHQAIRVLYTDCVGFAPSRADWIDLPSFRLAEGDVVQQRIEPRLGDVAVPIKVRSAREPMMRAGFLGEAVFEIMEQRGYSECP